MSIISEVRAREILDSRGKPTVEVDIILANGAQGRALTPSGVSTGIHEAVELRDRDHSRFNGLGVLKAIENIHQEIAPIIIGRSPIDQEEIDKSLIDLDGTQDKSRLGANSIIAVSMAVAHAAASDQKMPLYQYLAGDKPVTLPVPMFNMLNGGRHSDNSTDFQEFMVVPSGLSTFRQAMQSGAEIYHSLRCILKNKRLSTNVGDEGGFAPSIANEEAINIVLEAIELAGYKPGVECFIALDVAASELIRNDGQYYLKREQKIVSPEGLIETYEKWVNTYPIISIEDGISEDDWTNWSKMTRRMSSKTQLVGDDLYTTNPNRLRLGIDRDASNAVLLKVNQIGTITEVLKALQLAKEAGWGTIISHRSGETEDTTIAELAVATAAGQIKAGAPSRGERTAKYNRLLRIEEELSEKAPYAGPEVYNNLLGYTIGN